MALEPHHASYDIVSRIHIKEKTAFCSIIVEKFHAQVYRNFGHRDATTSRWTNGISITLMRFEIFSVLMSPLKGAMSIVIVWCTGIDQNPSLLLEAFHCHLGDKKVRLVSKLCAGWDIAFFWANPCFTLPLREVTEPSSNPIRRSAPTKCRRFSVQYRISGWRRDFDSL